MTRLLLRRLLVSVPLILVVSWLAFLLESVAPGDTARTILGEQYTPAKYAALREELGLNDSLPVQYWHWLSHAVQGDLGRSPISGLDVAEEITRRLPVTLSLIIGATIVAALVGVGLGLLSGVRGGWLGRLVDGLSLVGAGVPSFWLGLVLVAVFSVRWQVFPVVGYTPLAEGAASWARSLVLDRKSVV